MFMLRRSSHRRRDNIKMGFQSEVRRCILESFFSGQVPGLCSCKHGNAVPQTAGNFLIATATTTFR
jgi:hypothetical protein